MRSCSACGIVSLAFVVGSLSSPAAVDALDTNLTALVCLDRVERVLLCGEPKEKANRNGILRTIGELERWIDPSCGRFPRAPEWAMKGLKGTDEAQLHNLSFAYARLLKHAGTAFGFPAYAARGRTMEERIIREEGRAPDFRDESLVPEEIRGYYALMEANRRELEHTIRPGDVNGQPFWNENALLFTYPPSFPFVRRDGAASYRFTVIDDVQAEHVFPADRPTAPLSPVWSELPVGFTTVRCEALDARGNLLGCVGTRRFWRAAPFDPSEYAPAKRDYATARQLTLMHLLAWPEIAYLETHGHPDISQGSNFTSYPSKMQSAVVNMMLEIAASVPADRERALRIARIAGDYLLSVRERPGAPLEGFTATYVGQGQLSGTYSGQHMLVYPAQAGAAFLKLFAATQDQKYLDAAMLIGKTYLRLQGADGTWFLKMNAQDGTPVTPNRLLPTSVLPFLESLYEVTKNEKFRAAADRAFASIDRGPLVDWDWAGQFEDVAPATKRYQNLTKHMACETALYLLRRFPGDAARLAQAREILRFSEDQFVMWKTPCRPDGTGAWTPGYPFFAWRAPTVLEQYRCYSPIDASASKLMKTYLALYRAEGRPLDLAKAKALGDSMVNNQDDNGRIRTYWIPEPGDDDPLAGAIRLPLGGDWFNCMASDVEALAELVSATASNDQAGNRNK